MRIQMKCSPEGVIIDRTGVNLQMVTTGETANVYWLRDIKSEVNKTIEKCGRFIQAQIPEATSEYDCTTQYDPFPRPLIKTALDNELKWKISINYVS